MGIVFRQSVKSTIVLATGALLGGIINYSYSFVLTEQQLGFNRVLIYVAVVFHLLLLLGISATLTNFFPRYEHKDQRKILITLGFLVPTAMTLLLTGPYFLFKEPILQFFQPADRPLARTFFGWLPVLVYLLSCVMVLESYLIAQSKMAITSFFREVVVRLCNLVALLLLFLELISFYQYIVLFIGSYAINLLLLFWVSRRTDDFGFSFKWPAFNKADYKEIAVYSWYHMLVSSTLTLMGYVDSFILARYGLSSLAVYGHAVFLVAIMIIPYRAMTISAVIVLNQTYLEGNHEKLKDIFHRSGVNILIAALLMFLLISCNLDNVVAILPPQFAAIKPLAIILMLGRMIDMATGLNNELTAVSKYYKYNFRISVLLLVMLVIFNIFLIPKYGIYGAAWGTTSAIGLANILRMLLLWIKMRIQPFTSRSLLAVSAAAVAALPGFFLPFMINPYIDTIARSTAIVFAYILLIIYLKPSADLNSYMAMVQRDKKLF